jgi:hypothetical protein
LLFVLNHDSWFIACAPVVVDVLLSDWLPPNASVCTPLVPSSNSELTRTRPPGSVRYGSE